VNRATVLKHLELAEVPIREKIFSPKRGRDSSRRSSRQGSAHNNPEPTRTQPSIGVEGSSNDKDHTATAVSTTVVDSDLTQSDMPKETLAVKTQQNPATGSHESELVSQISRLQREYAGLGPFSENESHDPTLPDSASSPKGGKKKSVIKKSSKRKHGEKMT
jgi:hypothetical protein